MTAALGPKEVLLLFCKMNEALQDAVISELEKRHQIFRWNCFVPSHVDVEKFNALLNSPGCEALDVQDIADVVARGFSRDEIIAARELSRRFSVPINAVTTDCSERRTPCGFLTEEAEMYERADYRVCRFRRVLEFYEWPTEPEPKEWYSEALPDRDENGQRIPRKFSWP